jgi:uncharacterized protein (TIGR03435 family)
LFSEPLADWALLFDSAPHGTRYKPLEFILHGSDSSVVIQPEGSSSLCIRGAYLLEFTFFSRSPAHRTKPTRPRTSKPPSVRLAGKDSSRFDGPRIQTGVATFTGHAASVRAYILWAYRVLPAQLLAPDWLDDVRVDIVAKAAAPANDQQLSMMLQTLLAERLALKAHVEEKEMPVYALTQAKGGAKLSDSATEGPRNVEREQGVEVYWRWSMYELLSEFSSTLGRPILDETGLRGRYDFRINPAAVLVDPQERDRASILISVLRGQLGLNIESRKAKVEVLIIDHVEKTPTEN